jgi:hypothetical protein
MNVKFKYISKDQSTNSVVVRYYTDLVGEYDLNRTTDFSISLPIPALSPDALYAFIVSKAPMEYLATKEYLLTNTTDMSHINVDYEMVLDTSVLQQPAVKTSRREEIRIELIATDIAKIRPISEGDLVYLELLNKKTKDLRAELLLLA